MRGTDGVTTGLEDKPRTSNFYKERGLHMAVGAATKQSGRIGAGTKKRAMSELKG